MAWGTRQENENDKIRHGTTNRGTRNGMAKLNETIVAEMRRRYAAGGVTQQQLADEFGTSNGNVNRIIKGLAWTHPTFKTKLPDRFFHDPLKESKDEQ